jgi:type II secretory pathway component PulF
MKNRLNLILLVFLVPAIAAAQQFQLQGQGGAQLSAFAHTIIGFVFWAVLLGVVIMGSVVAWKLTHDQRGFDHLKNWIFGLVFLMVVEGIAAYFLYAAQNSGLNPQGTLF